MAGPRVPRFDGRRTLRQRSSLLVVVALSAGLLFGAIACAAGMVAGHATRGDESASSSVASLSADDHASHPSDVHASHQASPDTVRDAPVGGGHPVHDRGGHADDAPTVEGHPGMACVVSIDLRFPETSVSTWSRPCGHVAATSTVEWSADVDPPVPRSS